ncbi:metal-dependent hydrolase [Cohnella panacarvi]|uniref:metal-dependent hydrolase n=1 Tax=Cohnella panacarvi TaxID=400776 RepID=UPI000478BB8D|nr:metal-dependent hydrolase [Cohnella panacarvi]
MFAGHFGLAAGVKAKAPELPLWVLMVSAQLLDVAFIPMVVAGKESMDFTQHGEGYGKAIIHADYTHSLLGALLIAIIAGVICEKIWGARAGWVAGGVAFSHWVLDLIVHRADMPLLPGNWGDFPLLGFGAWRSEMLSAGMELLLLSTGFVMYVRYAFRKAGSEKRKTALLTSVILGIVLAGLLATDVSGML